MFKIGECEQEWSLEFSDFAYFYCSLDSFAFLGLSVYEHVYQRGLAGVTHKAMVFCCHR